MQTAVFCSTQPMNNGIFCVYEYFLDDPFLSHLYELYLSIKDLEISDEFTLLQNLHLSTQKICQFQQAPDLLEKFAEIEDKKVFAIKNISKNITAGVLLFRPKMPFGHRNIALNDL